MTCRIDVQLAIVAFAWALCIQPISHPQPQAKRVSGQVVLLCADVLVGVKRSERSCQRLVEGVVFCSIRDVSPRLLKALVFHTVGGLRFQLVGALFLTRGVGDKLVGDTQLGLVERCQFLLQAEAVNQVRCVCGQLGGLSVVDFRELTHQLAEPCVTERFDFLHRKLLCEVFQLVFGFAQRGVCAKLLFRQHRVVKKRVVVFELRTHILNNSFLLLVRALVGGLGTTDSFFNLSGFFLLTGGTEGLALLRVKTLVVSVRSSRLVCLRGATNFVTSALTQLSTRNRNPIFFTHRRTVHTKVRLVAHLTPFAVGVAVQALVVRQLAFYGRSFQPKLL